MIDLLLLGSITNDWLNESTELFNSDPKNELARSVSKWTTTNCSTDVCSWENDRNAMTTTAWGTILINRDEFQMLNTAYSKKLPDMKITNQKQSGRCWLFAALNLFRREMVKVYNLPDTFELSQPYMFFYDKFEKCNYFLEQIIRTMDDDVHGRLVQHLLTDPTNDGGQWDMLVNLVNKYGVVPKSVYPESETSGASRPLNTFLKSKLREFAKILRTMHHSGKSESQLRVEKEKMMQTIHRIMIIHLGTPPTKFDWTVHDKDNKFLSFRNLTPLEFYKQHIPVDVNEYVSVVNDPRNPYNRTLTVDKLGNIIGGNDVLYVNAPVEDLARYAKTMLDRDIAVWFGCDVGKDSSMRKNGIMSRNIFNYELVFGTTPTMSKKDRLTYHESEMTHAMLFTGYDEDPTDSTKASKWRVENSWGDERSEKGYDLMTAGWFEEHMYQVVVPKNILSAEHLAALESEPIVLPVWDPMGSLAKL